MPGLPGAAVEDVMRVGRGGIGARTDRCRRLASHGGDRDRGVEGSGEGGQARSAQVGRRLVGSANTPGGAVPPLLRLVLVLGMVLRLVLGLVLGLVLSVELGLVLLPVDVVDEAVVQLAEVRSKCSLRPMLP